VLITLDGPANATLRIDGVEQRDWFGERVLQVGMHRFEFIPPNGDCCEPSQPLDVEIKPPSESGGPQTVRGVIKFRPATLDIPGPVGWTASCGLGKFAIPFQKQFEMQRPFMTMRCLLLPPEGSAEDPKDLEVRLTAGGTFTVR